MVLHNNGNMRIDNVTVYGDSNTCSKALMLPDETFICSMSKMMQQDDYEAGQFTLTATNVTGVAHGPAALPNTPGDTARVGVGNLNQTAILDVEAVTNITDVYRAGKTASCTIRPCTGGNAIGVLPV